MSTMLRAICGLVVAAALLLGAELALRSALGPPPAAIAVYEAIGEYDHFLQFSGDKVSRAYGQDILPDFPLTSDGPRIAVLGGSSVHGGSPGVSVHQEFPAHIARQLDVEVLNLGAPGLDSHDLVRLLDELEPVSLSTLVVYAGHNDVGNAYFEDRYGDVQSAVFAHVHGAASHLQLYAKLSRAVRPLTGSDRRWSDEPVRERSGELDMTEERRVITLRAFEANLERIAWLTEQRGIQLVLMVPVCKLMARPAPTDCAPGECPRARLSRALSLVESDPSGAVAILQDVRDKDVLAIRAPTVVQDLVRSVAARHPHIHLIDTFVDLPRDRVFDIPDRQLFTDPVHFSRDGHRVMGELVSRHLEALE